MAGSNVRSGNSRALARRAALVPALVAALMMVPAASAAAQPAAAPMVVNSPRLRALDFSPFDTALARFTDGYATVIGTLIATASVPDVQAAMLDAAFAKTGAQVLVSLDTEHSPYYATAGYPAVTVPLGARSQPGGQPGQMGVSQPGVPVGVTLIGKPGEDARLLGYAFAFEQASRLRLDPRLR